MSHVLPPPMIGLIAVAFGTINTIFWAIPFYVLTLLRCLAPEHRLRLACDRGLTRLAELWVSSNSAALGVLHATDWQVEGVEGLPLDASYLVNSNHQSWTDIVVLQRAFNGRIPFLRFFIKQELMWVPILGLAWWALHFPFVKRYSRETLERHPELRGKDLQTTRKVCARLRGTPISILNFLEGTRFTPAKHEAQRSPYRHLLRPKTGGFAFVLGAMGDQFRSMLDVTVVYPGGRPTFWQFLCGLVPAVVVVVQERPIPRELLTGDYTEDAEFRAGLQAWLQGLWHDKDATIEHLVAARGDGQEANERSETAWPERSLDGQRPAGSSR